MYTDNQIEALKYLILKSQEANELAKRIMFWLIEKSEGLTKDVCICLNEADGEFSADEIQLAARSFDHASSSNSRSHLGAVFRAMNSEFSFHMHYGDFDPTRAEGERLNTDGIFAGHRNVLRAGDAKEGMPMRYSFSLARFYHQNDADLIPTSRKQLEAIDLSESLEWLPEKKEAA